MLVYGLLLYVCDSRQDLNGAWTFTRVVIVDRLSLWGVSLPSTANRYRPCFTPVPFSQARTLAMASLHFSYDLPQLTLRALGHRSATLPIKLLKKKKLPPLIPSLFYNKVC